MEMNKEGSIRDQLSIELEIASVSEKPMSTDVNEVSRLYDYATQLLAPKNEYQGNKDVNNAQVNGVNIYHYLSSLSNHAKFLCSLRRELITERAAKTFFQKGISLYTNAIITMESILQSNGQVQQDHHEYLNALIEASLCSLRTYTLTEKEIYLTEAMAFFEKVSLFLEKHETFTEKSPLFIELERRITVCRVTSAFSSCKAMTMH